jgi:hypothetical protein
MIERNQSSLLKLAGVFLALFAIILSLSPSVRERAWDVTYRWQHWVGFLAWVGIFTFAHVETKRHLPERDPYLLPVAAMLTGWGLLTIWRLTPEFGLRQTVWMIGTVGLLALSLRFPLNLEIVRRYKYVILTGGLILTSLTLIFGTNPAGTGPRCGWAAAVFTCNPLNRSNCYLSVTWLRIWPIDYLLEIVSSRYFFQLCLSPGWPCYFCLSNAIWVRPPFSFFYMQQLSLSPLAASGYFSPASSCCSSPGWLDTFRLA